MKRCCRSFLLRVNYNGHLLSRNSMNLNNCHNCVIRRPYLSLLKSGLAGLLLVSLALSLTLSACGRPSPQAPGLTQPSTQTTPREDFSIPKDRPLTPEEALEAARILDREKMDYDLLRPGGAADLTAMDKVRIDRVVDGDTFIVYRKDRPQRLRLIGLDAPESYSHHDPDLRTHPGESVSRIVEAWLDGREVYLQFDKEKHDPYERLLAYMWLDEHTMVNEVLVRQGLVWQHRYPPNTRFNDYFEELEALAKNQGRGIWGNAS